MIGEINIWNTKSEWTLREAVWFMIACMVFGSLAGFLIGINI